MEDIWNITALVVSVLSVLLSLYALRQATTKNTSDMYLFFISQYAKEDMKLALRKLKDRCDSGIRVYPGHGESFTW